MSKQTDLKRLKEIDKTIFNRLQTIGENKVKLNDLTLTNHGNKDIRMSYEEAEKYSEEKKLYESKIEKWEKENEDLTREAELLEENIITDYPVERPITVKIGTENITFKIENTNIYGEKRRRIIFL